MSARIERHAGPDVFALMYADHIRDMSIPDQLTMSKAFDNSTAVWIGYQDDKVLGAWGLAPPSFCASEAYLWLYTTPALTEHVFTFVRHSQKAVAEMLQTYPRIHGHCVIGADKSIRWLRWLGAKFGPPQGKLRPFVIEAPRG